MKLVNGVLIIVIAQVISFLQLQSQSRFQWAKDNSMIMMLLGLPISYLFLNSTRLINEHTGATWPGRLIGQAIGIVIFSLMSWLIFKEQMTVKTAVCITLAITVVIIQIFWK
jgi:multidrug transporter EmrE-like cation transporter